MLKDAPAISLLPAIAHWYVNGEVPLVALAAKLIVEPTQAAALGLAVIAATGFVNTVTIIGHDVEVIPPSITCNWYLPAVVAV